METITEKVKDTDINCIYDRKLKLLTAVIQDPDPNDPRPVRICTVTWVWHKYAPLDNSYKAYDRTCITMGQNVEKLWNFLWTNYKLREPVYMSTVNESYQQAYKHCDFLKYRQYKPGRQEK